MEFIDRLNKVLLEQEIGGGTESGEMKETEQEIQTDVKGDLGGDVAADDENYVDNKQLVEVLKNFVSQEQFKEFLEKLDKEILQPFDKMKKTFRGF
jgi:hypothetical protein